MTGALVSFPLCSICKKVVDLKTSKTDEDGYAIHEECYVPKFIEALRPGPISGRRKDSRANGKMMNMAGWD